MCESDSKRTPQLMQELHSGKCAMMFRPLDSTHTHSVSVTPTACSRRLSVEASPTPNGPEFPDLGPSQSRVPIWGGRVPLCVQASDPILILHRVRGGSQQRRPLLCRGCWTVPKRVYCGPTGTPTSWNCCGLDVDMSPVMGRCALVLAALYERDKRDESRERPGSRA